MTSPGSKVYEGATRRGIVRPLVAIVVSVLVGGCTSPAVPPGPTTEPSEPGRGSIYVYVRSPRSTYEDVSNFSIRIVAPDLQERLGTVGTDPVSVETCGGRASGDFHCRDPENVGPYPYTHFEDVQYNGTWHIWVNRTENRNVILPQTGNPGGIFYVDTNACAYFGFGQPNMKVRVLTADPGHEVPNSHYGPDGSVVHDDPLSHGHIAVEYWGNYTMERFREDTCQD